MIVCDCGTTACIHTALGWPSPSKKIEKSAWKKPHACKPPRDYWYRTLQWECGVCGAVYSPTHLGWEQVKGPSE